MENFKTIKTIREFNNAIKRGYSISYKGRIGSNKWFSSWKKATVVTKINEGLLAFSKPSKITKKTTVKQNITKKKVVKKTMNNECLEAFKSIKYSLNAILKSLS